MTTPSHTVGETDVPLLEQTIPDNLDATVARFADREALVDFQRGIRWTYAEFAGEVRLDQTLARSVLPLKDAVAQVAQHIINGCATHPPVFDRLTKFRHPVSSPPLYQREIVLTRICPAILSYNLSVEEDHDAGILASR